MKFRPVVLTIYYSKLGLTTVDIISLYFVVFSLLNILTEVVLASTQKLCFLVHSLLIYNLSFTVCGSVNVRSRPLALLTSDRLLRPGSDLLLYILFINY